MDYTARYVTLIAKPDSWFDAGTEVFHYDYNPKDKVKITTAEYEEWKLSGSILCRGLHNGEWDGEWCDIDEFIITVDNTVMR